MNVKVIRKHNKDCAAIQAVKDGVHKTPYYFSSSTEQKWLDAEGNEIGDFCWYEVGCNSTDCKAAVLVRGDFLSEMIYGAVQAAERSKRIKKVIRKLEVKSR